MIRTLATGLAIAVMMGSAAFAETYRDLFAIDQITSIDLELATLP
ncbi:hypothetical protein [Phaeobacter porticola]|uniref:Uncharacterized protein n=1 Tax=Phaeobacter porticola TaxID=1844006 RepID=A0A1L3IAR5_9RHOB|nr:hypothetical protein [Phaeobacter porticola]APG49186.1 hypothetical protein PhaeoP97_03836 [Phaeobacter porticola]